MASTVKPHQRAFALTIALIFLATTIATTALVIITIINDNKNKDSSSSLTDSSLNATDNPGDGTNANSLAGKKLENFTPVENVTTLQSTDLKQGDGEEVKAGAQVTAHYTGAVAATGIIFQSSKDGGQPIPFSLDGVIKGWTEGVPGMKVGGIRRLVIPADLAYGANPPEGSGIPANAALVFDIELTAVTNK